MMTASRSYFLLALALCLSGGVAHATDDRMAGTKPQMVEEPIEAVKEAPVKKEPKAVKKTPEVLGPTKTEKKESEKKSEEKVPAPEDKKAEEKPETKAETKVAPKEEAKADPVKEAPKEEEKKLEAPATPVKAPVINTPRPRTGQTMDRAAMESLGPLTNPLKGSLGNDMWAGSARSVVQEFIPQLPAGNTFYPAQLLARRVLISNGDVTMMRNDKSPAEGQDLFTQRLEKLLEIGAYDDAVKLYTLIEGEPGHDRLARAGVMALLHGGFPAQACLEARAAHKDTAPQSENDIFWSQINAICMFVQAQSVRAVKDAGFTKDDLAAFDQAAATDVPGSKLLTMLVNRPDYRYSIGSPDDITELSNLERAVFKGMGRFDYSRLKIKKMHAVPAITLMTMAGDPNMPANLRLAVNIEAAARGLIDTDGLAALYMTLSENAPATSLTGRYAAISKATATKAEKAAIIAALLETRGDGRNNELPSHLLPFSQMIAESSPDGLSPAALQMGLNAILQAGIVPSERWVKAWLAAESGDSKKTRNQVLLYLANLVPENLPTNSVGFADDQVKTAFTPPEGLESLRIWAVFDGLGRSEALKNLADPVFYEKHVDLTLTTDYVMPSDSLLEKLRDAAQNGRLGETALLASVALNSGYPDKIHPGVIKEVLKSLETVGLKEEARHMALGVVMGLKQ